MNPERSPVLTEIRATLGVAAPLAAANLAQMAMGITNTIMVGQLGAAPLAAAGLGAMLFYMLAMLCQGVLTAVAPLAAHAIGADDHPTAGRVAGAGLIVAAVLALPIVAILTAVPSLLGLLGYEPALAAAIGEYLRMIRWGAPAFLGFAVLRFLLVASFRTRIVMLVPLCAIPINAALNWLLIFGHLGLPALGAAVRAAQPRSCNG
jgi:MATE family multidrug resistance protein